MMNPPVDRVAPVSRRVIAFVIDGAIAFGLTSVVGVIAFLVILGTGDAGVRLAPLTLILVWLVVIAWLLIYTAMQGGRGSLGMRAQRIRLVREENGRQLGFGKALLRNLLFGLTASIIIGYFTVLLDKSGRSQGWHDKLVGSLMVETVSVAGAATPPDIMNTLPPLPVPPRTAALPVTPAPPAPAPAHSFPTVAERAPAQPERDEVPDAAPDETVIAPAQPPRDEASVAPPAPATPPAAAPATPPPGAGAGLIAFVPGVTNPPAPTPVAEPVSPAQPVSVPEPVEGPEIPVAASAPLEEDIESTRISVPGHRLVFTWDDGTRTEVSKRTVFGRNPAPEAGALVVTVRDETLSLSKTHFEAEAESAGGWVMDRHSTNGMTIVRGGERITCTPGEKVRVRLGDAIEIGERIVTIGGYA